jgi:hypothetical protein
MTENEDGPRRLQGRHRAIRAAPIAPRDPPGGRFLHAAADGCQHAPE